jgi:hypothetical protein
MVLCPSSQGDVELSVCVGVRYPLTLDNWALEGHVQHGGYMAVTSMHPLTRQHGASAASCATVGCSAGWQPNRLTIGHGVTPTSMLKWMQTGQDVKNEVVGCAEISRCMCIQGDILPYMLPVVCARYIHVPTSSCSTVCSSHRAPEMQT